MDWDDLRIIAAIRASGSYAGAGTRLRINETTVARRLDRLQKSLGFTLFDAVDGVRKPTAQCEEILQRIQSIERHIAEIEAVGNSSPGITGSVRIAATNAIMEELLAPHLPDFLLNHPGVTLQLMTSNQNVDFSRWQADLAIRLRKPDKGDFKIVKLTTLRLYFFEPVIDPSHRGETVVCAYPASLDLTPESRFLTRQGLQPHSRVISDNIRIVRTLISSYRCAGILPAYACTDLLSDPKLRATLLDERREVWLLIQRHLASNPAARLAIDWVRDCFADASIARSPFRK